MTVASKNYPIARYRFSAAEYEQMGTAGIFAEDVRVELIDGEIIRMSPIGDPHAGRVIALTGLLADSVRSIVWISIQNPVRLSQYSQPQPDVVLIRRDAPLGKPVPEQVLLIIEVSDSTLRFDSEVKLPLYAAAGIPETWIVDIGGEVLERYSDPIEGTYRQVARAHRGESLASTVVPEMVLSVDAVLG